MFLKRNRVKAAGNPESELPPGLQGLLEEHDGEGKASKDQNQARKEWQDPEIRYQMERLEQLLDPAKIRDEASDEVFVGNLRRMRRKLRETVDRRLGVIREVIDGPSEEGIDAPRPSARERSSLEHLRTRWTRLSAALQDGSPYSEALELQTRRRWSDAHRAGSPIGVLATCTVFAATWLFLAALVYFYGFVSAVADWQEQVASGEVVLEALLRPPETSLVVLLVAVVLVASWLAYRFLVDSSVKKAAEQVQNHVGALARYARLVLPLPDDDELPSVPQPAKRFKFGFLTWPVVWQPRFAGVLLIALSPLVACWLLVGSKEPYHVMAGVEDCRDFHGLIVQRNDDHLVFFADLEELRTSGEEAGVETGEVPEAGDRRGAFGALVLPVGSVRAMAEGDGDLVPCPVVRANTNEDEESPLYTAELVGVLESIRDQLHTFGGTQERATRNAVNALGVAIGQLGSGLEASGKRHRIELERLIKTASATSAELADIERLLRDTAGSSTALQGELLELLRRQIGFLEEQSSFLDGQATMARLDLCLEARNKLVKTLKTLFPGGEDKYVQALEKRCQGLLGHLNGIGLTSGPEAAELNGQGP